MHARSPYAEYTDFAQLAKDCPAFAKYLIEEQYIDFKDPNAVRELTKSLLKRDFGLQVELPEDRLCPTVPNRLNYILWIQDLLDSTGGGITDGYDPARKVVGLDIGTGASCIYPLLGCASRESWSMIGTDIDAASLRSARANVSRNKAKLGDRIAVFESTPEGPFFAFERFGVGSVDFTMCNPPFYESVDEMFASAKAKHLPPSSACTGTTTEMVHSPGGEVSFTLRQLHESLRLPHTQTWFTTMLGKLSSVACLVAALKPHTTNYALTEFRQGSTRRWGVAWSFGDRRPSLGAERYVNFHHAKGLMPFPTEFEVEAAAGVAVEAARGVVEGLGAELELEAWRVDVVAGRVVANGEARGNVWSRAARRAKARGEKVEGEGVQLGFRVEVGKKGEGEGEGEGGEVRVRVRWTRGVDSVLFESFCGMVKRKFRGEGSGEK